MTHFPIALAVALAALDLAVWAMHHAPPDALAAVSVLP